VVPHPAIDGVKRWNGLMVLMDLAFGERVVALIFPQFWFAYTLESPDEGLSRVHVAG